MEPLFRLGNRGAGGSLDSLSCTRFASGLDPVTSAFERVGGKRNPVRRFSGVQCVPVNGQARDPELPKTVKQERRIGDLFLWVPQRREDLGGFRSARVLTRERSES